MLLAQATRRQPVIAGVGASTSPCDVTPMEEAWQNMTMKVTTQQGRTCGARAAVHMVAYMHKDADNVREIQIEGDEDTLRLCVQHALLSGRMPDMVHAPGAGARPGRAARVPWQGGEITVKWPGGGREQALASAQRRQQSQRDRVSSSSMASANEMPQTGRKRKRNEWTWGAHAQL